MRKISLIIQCLLMFGSCIAPDAKHSPNPSLDTIHNIDKMREEASKNLKNADYATAERLILKAITIESSSDLYLDLFSIYAVQDNTEKANEAINTALLIDENNADAYFLKAKYLFYKYNVDSLDETLSTLAKAKILGNESSDNYINIIHTAEKYKNLFLNQDIDGLIKITPPDAIANFYGSKHNARRDFKNVFAKLESTGAKLVDWQYFIPNQVFSENNNRIAVLPSGLKFTIQGETYQMKDKIIVISTDNGNNWYTLSYQQTHQNYLSQFFDHEILNQIFK